MNNSLLGGKIHTDAVTLRPWEISWESDGVYRHWCSQIQRAKFNGQYIAVCLLNPGSLSGAGANLARDTTLRILREIFRDTGYGCLVVNLFDRATPKPPELFKPPAWSARDKADAPLIYSALPANSIAATMEAFGNYAHVTPPAIASEIRARISVLRDWRACFPSIDTPSNPITKEPLHVMRWQIERHKPTLRGRIVAFPP